MMSEAELKTVTHKMHCDLSGSRRVTLSRLEDGGVQYEWTRPDPDNGMAMVTTTVGLSEEAFIATLKLGMTMFDRVAEEQEATAKE